MASVSTPKIMQLFLHSNFHSLHSSAIDFIGCRKDKETGNFMVPKLYHC